MNTRLGVLVLLIWFAGVNLAQAQEEPCDCADAPQGCLHRLKDNWRRKSCGYGKTHHDFGCIGCHADNIFVFGSCWQFFEEPCFRQPPVPRNTDGMRSWNLNRR